MTFPEEKGISTIPNNFTFQQAAASLEGVHYAYNMINKVALKEGQKALVNGASGAIGSAAVQLLKYYGAQVTAVCSTKNIELIKSIGADKVIDYTRDDFTKSIEKYHYVLDAVGKSSFALCKPLLEKGGIYISSELGRWSQNLFFAVFTPLLGKKKVVFPFPSDHRRTVLLIKKIIEEGKFTAVIDRKYPLEEIADAYRYVETGEKTGNVVITMED
jgi:NADPH:quinone reductase-like Zn-dependent oxidoreductase